MSQDPAPLQFLVVDALEGVRKFARQLIEAYGFAPAQVHDSASPEAALERLQAGLRPDFLISDWFAKGPMSGIALHREICRQQPGCRLALLSFDTGPERQAEAQAVGARFLLHKPFTPEQLKQTLRQSLQALAQERPDLARRLNAVMAAPRAPGRPAEQRIALPALPAVPPLRPGDRVEYGGRSETVQHVVIRHGELVVQLQNKNGLIPAEQLRRKPA